MTDTKQPEALRLAARLDPAHSCKTTLLDLHREAAAELRRLHKENVQMSARVAELDANLKLSTSAMADMEAQLYTLGSNGITSTKQNSIISHDIDALTMCADQHCPEFGTCYRAQAKPTPDQRFWAVSPREDNSCRFYAPIYFINGASALREDAQ